VHRLIGAGGLIAQGAPSGSDGIPKAHAQGSSGKLVGTEGVETQATSTPTVNVLIDGNTEIVSGGDVTVSSTSGAYGIADSRNVQGGLVAVGTSEATTKIDNTTTAYIGSGVSITAQNQFTLLSESLNQAEVFANSKGYGGIPFSESETSVDIAYTTQTWVDGHVTA